MYVSTLVDGYKALHTLAPVYSPISFHTIFSFALHVLDPLVILAFQKKKKKKDQALSHLRAFVLDIDFEIPRPSHGGCP